MNDELIKYLTDFNNIDKISFRDLSLSSLKYFISSNPHLPFTLIFRGKEYELSIYRPLISNLFILKKLNLLSIEYKSNSIDSLDLDNLNYQISFSAEELKRCRKVIEYSKYLKDETTFKEILNKHNVSLSKINSPKTYYSLLTLYELKDDIEYPKQVKDYIEGNSKDINPIKEFISKSLSDSNSLLYKQIEFLHNKHIIYKVVNEGFKTKDMYLYKPLSELIKDTNNCELIDMYSYLIILKDWIKEDK